MAEIECGKDATKVMRRLIAGNPVSCQERDVDRYGRVVAVCLNAEGQDVGAELVRLGWAQDGNVGDWRRRSVWS